MISLKNNKDENSKIIYTESELCELLNVSSKWTRKYRYNGLLGYHQIGKKIFYTLEDVKKFFDYFREEAYALEN